VSPRSDRDRKQRIGAVFSALSDPTRREVLEQLADTDSATASELAVSMPVSRQAVVKHLQALGRAGLATPVREGREVRYSFTPAPLDDAADWMTTEGARWEERLARLRRQLEAGP
jgi:DNA-binding transcriptional ArsR family regulator